MGERNGDIAGRNLGVKKESFFKLGENCSKESSREKFEEEGGDFFL